MGWLRLDHGAVWGCGLPADAYRQSRDWHTGYKWDVHPVGDGTTNKLVTQATDPSHGLG